MTMTTSWMQFLDRWLGVSICRLLSVLRFFLPGRSSNRDETPSVVLVIQVSEMGSILLAYTMLARLQRRYPGVTLYFLTFERNRGSLEVLGSVDPEHVIPLSDHSLWSFLVSALRAVILLRRRRVDTVFDLEMFSRASAILSFLTGARRRAGFERHSMEGLYRGNFLTHPVCYNPYLHMGRNYIALLDSVEHSSGRPLVKLDYSDLDLKIPRARITQPVRRRVKRLLEDSWGTAEKRPAERILFNMSGGALPVRAWPFAHFVELAKRLLDREQARIGVIGLAEDAPLFQRLAARTSSRRLADFTGCTADIFELIELLNQCDVLVTADSGTAHFAALADIHSFVLFGPETPLLYAPLGTNNTILYQPLACSPCLTAFNHRRSPCDGQNRCVQQFTPDQVYSRLVQRLELNQRLNRPGVRPS